MAGTGAMPERAAAGEAPELLRMQRISKSFSGVPVLHEVTLRVRRGEVHALIGENGAGKSTLMKILGGAVGDHEGEILIAGQPVAIASPRDAEALGIAVIYQELNLVPELSAAENIFLGREPRRFAGFIDGARMTRAAQAILDTLHFPHPAGSVVARLRVGEQQMVEIAKALSLDARILIMDEPTAALGPQETAQVGDLIKQLKREGIGIFLISHDIHDVFDLADRVSVMKNGQVVGQARTEDVTKDEVLGMIIMGKVPPKAIPGPGAMQVA
jgi:D-xylose transport system ATP-binding protein